MPTKTDRIISYLPRTFQTSPRPPVLYAVADAFGNELLLGENSLAALMLAHWVDFADKNAEQIDDLERMASLYGLAPRCDDHGEVLEGVEEFREHLKHYVRTFLEGTATVQGILRISAEALAIHIADENEQLDRWWTRQHDELVTVEPRGDDSAAGLFRFDRPRATGTPARPAQVTGTVDLSAGINLQGASTLRLKIDGVGPVEVDLGSGSKLMLKAIVDAINSPPRPRIAHHDGQYLTLASPHSGAASRLEILGGPNDAGLRLLGLAPLSYHGAAATSAHLRGTVDLSHGVDLSIERFLRLEVDGKHLAEIDCAGSDPAHTSKDEIRDAINHAFAGPGLAGDDGKHLILESKIKGFESSISLLPAAAQSAATAIFGVATAFAVGREAQPARVASLRDLRGGIDLSVRSNLRLRIDGGSAVTINCAGVDPAKTQRVEIAAAINSALKAEVATITERAISLASPTLGPASEIVFETAPAGDAANDIFGIASLSFEGSAATRARLAATPVLAKGGGVDVRAQNILSLAVDGAAPIEINLRRAAGNLAELESLSLDKVAAEINHVLDGPDVASTDGARLLLASPTESGASSLEITPLETVRHRRFVTRAVVTDEAAAAVFGFISREAKGTTAKTARVVGVPDLSQSADLQEQRFLRLRIDSHSAREIDCAGPRPRATTLDEIVANINNELRQAGLTKDVAAHDGKHLVLISPSPGADSRIAIESPRAALATLLGVEPGTVRGQDSTQVNFTSTVDLSAGIDLDPQAAIKIGFDGAPAKEISLAGPAPNHQSPAWIANVINIALQGAFARSDGRHISLICAKQGADSSIVFEVPSGPDVTKDVFGIAAPRSYKGDAGRPAKIAGGPELTGPRDLSASRFLRLSVDGAPAQDVDCAAKAAKPEAAKLAEIVESIGSKLAAPSPDGKHLVLTSPTAGSSSEITLEPYTAGDARQRLLGVVADITSGAPSAPAIITGEAVLLAPANLSSRSLLRLKVDGSRPVDVDVAGAVPAKTFLDEIVTKINGVFPNVATATDEDHLQLTSPNVGEESSLSLQPLRHLEVVEYPLQAELTLTRSVRHNDDWSVQNEGVAEVGSNIRITAPQGTVGPSLVNSTSGWVIRLFVVIEVGETASLRRDARLGLQAEIISRDGVRRPVPGSRILVGPLGAQAWVPFEGTWSLTGGPRSSELQLNNPLASAIVILRAQQSTDEISVSVIESDLTQAGPQLTDANSSAASLIGRVQAGKGEFSLIDASGNPIARLRSGPDTDLSAHGSHVVTVYGPLHAGVPPLMIVRTITRLFDVTFSTAPKSGPPREERYPRVIMGVGEAEEASLVKQVNGGARHVQGSTLVRAEELDKAAVLNLPPGETSFRYLDCMGSRFNLARFDYARFPDGVCGERGIFDVSRFTHVPPELVKAVFASNDPLSDPPVQIEFRWRVHQPGTFTVNLPADLPARFGARFNEGRFSQAKDAPEVYDGAVIEPETDDKFLVKLIGSAPLGKSNFVNASVVPNVDLGWTPVKLPFRKPQSLTLGRAGQAARLYLRGDGLIGFIKLEAKEPGAWGNQIAVAARPVGPAIYDVSVIYRASRFENARAAVLGQPAAELTQELLKPGPVGVLQAKAAGVRAEVTRDRAEYEKLTART